MVSKFRPLYRIARSSPRPCDKTTTRRQAQPSRGWRASQGLRGHIGAALGTLVAATRDGIEVSPSVQNSPEFAPTVRQDHYSAPGPTEQGLESVARATRPYRGGARHAGGSDTRWYRS